MSGPARTEEPIVGRAEAGAWVPGPGASEGLDALWKGGPFAVPAAVLKDASGGGVPAMFNRETLLMSSDMHVDEAGRGRSVTRVVWRVLDDAANQTQGLTWSPWRQERPKVRARVISTDGVESWLDAANIVEGAVSANGLELSDVRQLSIPLPNARRGSVVEFEVSRTDTRALVEGTGSMDAWRMWSMEPVRRIRVKVEVPASVPFAVAAVGIPEPTVRRSGGTQQVVIDQVPPQFSPWLFTRPELRAREPSFAWSTASSWEVVAQKYRPLLDEAMADRVDFAELEKLLVGVTGRQARVQAVVRWLSERVRYTALHLGAGAIVPTKPSVVLSRGFGDCKDMAVLATRALRAVGVSADVALAMAEGDVPTDQIAGLGAFNHMVVAVAPEQAGEAPLFVDVTAPEFPVGTVPSGIRDQRALIINPATRGLTSLPTRTASLIGLRQVFELRGSAFGAGSGRAVFEFRDAAEGLERVRVHACDEATAHEIAQHSVELVMGKTPFTARIEACKPGQGPVTVTADVKSTEAFDTGDQSFTARLPSQVVDLMLPDWLVGERPGTEDKRTVAQRDDESARLLARTGLTEVQFKNRAFSFENRPWVERVFRVTLPPRFTVATLPADRTLVMGPSEFRETYRKASDALIEVTFRYEVKKVDWSAEDVAQFREAFWKRFDEPIPQLSASFAPLQLLNEKSPTAAVALMRKWLDETPGDGATRARFARVLLQMGLGELATREVSRAMKDAPDEPLVAMVCSDVARHDAFGLRYHPPFDRQRSIDCMRKAREKLAHHTWANQALADTLRRNENGEPVRRWTADVEAAAKLLQAEVDANEASREMGKLLLEIYLATGRRDDVKRLLKAQPGLQDDDESQVVDILLNGPESTTRRALQIADPKERFMALMKGYGSLAYLRAYEEAGAFLAQVPANAELERELGAVREMHKGLRRAPEKVDVSNPEAAARSLAAIVANSSSPTEVAKRFSGLASSSGKAELDGTPHMFQYMRLPQLDQPYVFDHLYSRATCKADQVEAVVRVRCDVADTKKANMVSFWVKEGGALKLESLGKPSHLAQLAWDAARTSRTKSAATWIGWYVDELQARGADGRAAVLLKDFWSQVSHDDAAAVKFAGALSMVTYSDIARAASPEAIATLDTYRSELAGAQRRAADAVLSSALELQRRFDDAAKIIEPLAKSENEQWLWRKLASLESKGRGMDQATLRIAAALKKDPSSTEWRDLKAMVDLRAGRYDEAIRTLEALQQDKSEGIDVRNNLIWARLMAGKLDEQTERETMRLTSERSSEATLHTAAMVLLERGRVLEAANFGERRQASLGDEVDEPQWLFRGRLLNLLGFPELGREALSKVKEDPELVDLAGRYRMPQLKR